MAALLANKQAETNNVEIIYSNREETPENIDDYFKKNVILKNIQMLSTKEKIASILKIHKELKKTKPDAIFLHSSFAGFIGRAASIGLGNNVKIFYIPHCISFLRKDISKKLEKIFILLEKIAGIRKTSYIACSKSEYDAINKKLNPKKIYLVENAIEIEAKKTKKEQKNKIKKTIVAVGGIREQKGPEVFAEIAEKMPHYDFLWIGDGEEKEKNKLKKSNIEITGWMNKKDVIEKISDCDVYLSTSKWEGMPVSIIEALINEIPVVASNCEGNNDIIINNENGYLFDSIAEVEEKIKKSLNENPEKLQEIAKKSLQRFSPKRYLKDVERILNENP